jgi:hypothetical protein
MREEQEKLIGLAEGNKATVRVQKLHSIHTSDGENPQARLSIHS